MTRLLWKQNRSHDCSLSLITDCRLCFFSPDTFGLGPLISPLFSVHRPVSRVLFEIHHYLRELISPISTKPSTFACGAVCFSLQLISNQVSTCSVHRSHHWFKASVDDFWGVSVPNSNISHHIKNMSYNASCNVPSTSGTHVWWFMSQLMAARSHSAGRQKKKSHCFNLNTNDCVQHVYQSVIECSHFGRNFSLYL